MVKVKFRTGDLLEIEGAGITRSDLFRYLDADNLRLGNCSFKVKDVLWMYSDEQLKQTEE